MMDLDCNEWITACEVLLKDHFLNIIIFTVENFFGVKYWVQPKYEDKCMVCLENLIQLFSKINRETTKNPSKKLQNSPKWRPDGLWGPV